ncbi:MAG TPA: hypothetical protein VFR47_00790 [Anaerolineales bacterium]|nr:hypothetical protein [Anaerolineales bacterium]
MFLIIVVFATLALSSCRTSRISQTQIQLVQYSLKEADLPGSGWSVEGKSWESAYGGESYGITYIRDKLVFISHVVSIHSNEDQAQQAYKEWENEWFTIAKFQAITSFSPSNTNDTFRYECEEKGPGAPLGSWRLCLYLQRKNDLISFVKISLDESSKNNLTFEEINQILGILDKRLNEAAVDAKPEGATP